MLGDSYDEQYRQAARTPLADALAALRDCASAS
jgi:hypothetical protein